MANDRSSDPTGDETRGRVPGLEAARAQIAAARLRRESLIASGRLPRSSSAGPSSLLSRAIPGYTLLRQLHRGGQGVVYAALQQSTGRTVAVKVLLHGPFAGAAEVARFEREVELLSRLKHPNIVTIHDCGRAGEGVYLVMDYVAGRPLDTHVAHERPSVRDTLDLFAKVCDGVNAAHLRGVIHRDLKPGNILVVCDDGEGTEGSRDRGIKGEEPRPVRSSVPEPKVLDFGLAKLTAAANEASSAAAMTLTGQFVGSLPWASPEQAEGRSDLLDIRTDVYSLGVILYQLLTGRFPYPVAGRMDDVVRHIAHTSPARPSSVERSIGDEIETIVLKCLAKEPQRRYQSAGELARDVRHYLAGEPIEAKRDSLPYMVRKQLSRHRVAVAIVMSFALLLAGGLITSTTLWYRAEKALLDKEEQRELADQRADQARAVNEFMREVLTSVDPVKHVADVRLIDVLAAASATAPERFAGHPLQEAQVRHLLGEVYNNLSMWPKSRVEFEKALGLWRRHAGPDDTRTLVTESSYAGVALNMQETHDAEAVLTGLMPRMERVFGPDDSNTLDARRKLALTHAMRGREVEAERILLELRGHPNLADDDAMQIGILRSLLQLDRRRASGGEPAQYRTTMSRGEPLAREWIERSMRRHGPDSAVTLDGQVVLSEILCEQGQYRAAADACRAILDQSTERLGECHHVRSEAMDLLAKALTRLGEAREPAELHLRSIACSRQSTPNAIAIMGSISEALRYLDRAGRAVEGETLARELTASLLQLGGGHGDIAFDAELYVARFVSMQDRLDEAELMFESLLDREEQVQEVRTRARLHLLYGSYLARRGLFEKAEDELMTAVELIGDIRMGTLITHPDDVILEFIALYEAWGRPDKFQEYRGLREEVIGTPARTAEE